MWLAGEISRDEVRSLACHLTMLVDADVRFISVECDALASVDTAVLSAFSRAQEQLDRCGGMLSVWGLHPSLLSDRDI